MKSLYSPIPFIGVLINRVESGGALEHFSQPSVRVRAVALKAIPPDYYTEIDVWPWGTPTTMEDPERNSPSDLPGYLATACRHRKEKNDFPGGFYGRKQSLPRSHVTIQSCSCKKFVNARGSARGQERRRTQS
jgi:hypothetical protein